MNRLGNCWVCMAKEATVRCYHCAASLCRDCDEVRHQEDTAWDHMRKPLWDKTKVLDLDLNLNLDFEIDFDTNLGRCRSQRGRCVAYGTSRCLQRGRHGGSLLHLPGKWPSSQMYSNRNLRLNRKARILFPDQFMKFRSVFIAGPVSL